MTSKKIATILLVVGIVGALNNSTALSNGGIGALSLFIGSIFGAVLGSDIGRLITMLVDIICRASLIFFILAAIYYYKSKKEI
ncbi:MAG: hypothetical protein WAV41_03010 [Microgenomates group bacterium]